MPTVNGKFSARALLCKEVRLCAERRETETPVACAGC